MPRVISTEYATYLNGPAWVAKRVERLKLDQFKCSRCSQTENLQVHHRTYDRLGCERLDDLETLCAECHAREHGRDPSSLGVAGRSAREIAACAESRWAANGRNEILSAAEKAFRAMRDLRETILREHDPFGSRKRARLPEIVGWHLDEAEDFLRYATAHAVGPGEAFSAITADWQEAA